jgi:chromosome segregation ATPase
MAHAKETKQKENGDFCCSNPNCKSVFSQPKIIKYYVCPICLTLAEIEGVSSQPVIQESINEEKVWLHEDSLSVENQKSEEIEDLKIQLESKFEEIKKLKTENTNLNIKLGDTDKNLGIAKGQLEFINRKLGKKNEEIVKVTEKTLSLSKRIESLETERASDKVKIREDAGRIKVLEKRISDKDKNIKNLDELKEEAGRLTKQIEDTITDKNEAIAQREKAERRLNQALEARAKIQGELTDLREKMANSIRRESKTAEKNAENVKRIQDLELEIKTLKEKKQLATMQAQKPKDIEFEPVDEVQNLEENKIKMEKRIKSFEVQDLNANRFPHSGQNKTTGIDEEDSKSGNGCGYHFGYLSDRDKGEEIPNACVECSKSLDCMLSKVHQSNKTVKEIEKWYHFKR